MSGGSGITSLFANNNPIVTANVTSSGPIRVKDSQSGSTYSSLASQILAINQDADVTLTYSTSAATTGYFNWSSTKNLAPGGVDLILVNTNITLTTTGSTVTAPFAYRLFVELFDYATDTAQGQQRYVYGTSVVPSISSNMYSWRAQGTAYIENTSNLYYYKLGYTIQALPNTGTPTVVTSSRYEGSTVASSLRIIRLQ